MPFHKLTQWLCYSLMVPMTKLMQIHFAGVELMTGLPEYRNGGLLVDTGLLTLKPADAMRGLQQYQQNAMISGQPNVEVVPLFTADDDVVIEWRALTVGFLDELLLEVNKLLGLRAKDKLNLAQMLEAGTWKVCLSSCDSAALAFLHCTPVLFSTFLLACALPSKSTTCADLRDRVAAKSQRCRAQTQRDLRS